MAVTSDSYEARVSAAIVTMLATCAQFQTITETTAVAAAKNFIVEDDGGDDGKAVSGATVDTTGVFAVVRLGDTRRVERAWLTWGYEGDGSIMLLLRKDDVDTAPEGIRRARNRAGLIAVQLQTQVGGSGLLAFATFDLGEVSLAEESGSLAGSYYAPIAITWRDLP